MKEFKIDPNVFEVDDPRVRKLESGEISVIEFLKEKQDGDTFMIVGGVLKNLTLEEYDDQSELRRVLKLRPFDIKIEAKKGKPCTTKFCRLGDKECENYWGCRDTCRIVSERITNMKECPE